MARLAALLLALVPLAAAQSALYEYLKCRLCEVQPVSGKIDDCCCDVESVDQANTRHFLPILHDLTQTTYFRYFKADLWKPCPFWPEDGMCAIRDCAVCECDPDEIPACWREEDSNRSTTSAAAKAEAAAARDAASYEGGAHRNHAHSAQDPFTGATTDAGRIAELSRVNFPGDEESSGLVGWAEPRQSAASAAAGAGGGDTGAVWAATTASDGGDFTDGDDDEDSPDVKYVNLLANPEGYTGYTGPSARRIWQSIYNENCFPVTGGPDVGGMCYEQRVFFRMISGLQTSINTHIAMTYGDGRGSNSELFEKNHKGGSGGKGDAAAAAGDGAVASVVAAARRALARAAGVLTGRPERSAASHQAAGRTSPRELLLHPGLRPSIDMYVERIGRWPDRMRNLYFTFLFVLRALAVGRARLGGLDYAVGNATEEAATRRLVARLVDVEAPSVLAGFDESLMFTVTPEDLARSSSSSHKMVPASYAEAAAAHAPESMKKGDGACASGSGGGGGAGVLGDAAELQAAAADLAELTAQKERLRTVFRDKYRNISRIMDCVGCERCRLWGRLQFLGLGTAMKILFADDPSSVPLSRNEVVALVNVLHRLSLSLAAIQVMRDLEAQRALHHVLLRGLAAVGALVAALLVLRARLAPKNAAATAGKAAATAAAAEGDNVTPTPAASTAPQPDDGVGDGAAVTGGGGSDESGADGAGAGARRPARRRRA